MTILKNVLSFAISCSLLAACGGTDDPAGSGGAANSGSAGSDSAVAGSSATAGAGPTGAAGASPGNSVDATDCEAVGAQQKRRITALGCEDTSAHIAAGCASLYATKMCTAQWEALIDCLTPKPNSDFECDDDNELKPKVSVCTAQRSTFDGCTGK